MKEFEDITKTSHLFHMLVKQKSEDSYIVEMEDPKNGSIVGNALEDVNKSDWSVPPTPPSKHFQKCLENVLIPSPKISDNDSIDSYNDGTLVGSDWSATDRIVFRPHDSKNVSIWTEDGKLDEARTSTCSARSETSNPQLDEARAVLTRSARSEACDPKLDEARAVLTRSARSETYNLKLMREAVRVTSVVSSTDFTVQKTNTLAEYEKFLWDLQALALAQGPLTAFSKGKMKHKSSLFKVVIFIVIFIATSLILW